MPEMRPPHQHSDAVINVHVQGMQEMTRRAVRADGTSRKLTLLPEVATRNLWNVYLKAAGPPLFCLAPTVVLPPGPGGGRHLVNTKIFVTAHHVVVSVTVL